MSAVARADWHLAAVADDDDGDPFDVDLAEVGLTVEETTGLAGFAEAVTFGVEIDLDLVAIALGRIDLTCDDATLLRHAVELEQAASSIEADAAITCGIRTTSTACLGCSSGDRLLTQPDLDVRSVLCRNSRKRALVEQEVDARLARRP